MNGTTILLWITILIVGAIAIIVVKLHYKGNELEKDEEPIISNETITGILSNGRKEVADERISPENNAQPNLDYAIDNGYEVYVEESPVKNKAKNIEYESQNQVLINYENEVKKFQEPMNETQIDIMTSNDQNNEKRELKDLFTIDELIKESKRKDIEREKESQKIQTEDEDTSEIKESIKKRQENEDVEEKLIEEILADEEIGEILNGDDSVEENVEEVVEEPKAETIQDIIDSAQSSEEPAEEETVQEVLEVEEPEIEETPEEPATETIPEIEETPEEPAEEPKQDSIQEVLEVEEPSEEITPTTTQKDIEEAIDNASQEIAEEKVESISETNDITDALLNTEEEIKQPTLKSPTKIEDKESLGSPIDDSNLLSQTEEVNDLDYRKDLAKITNTIKSSRIFQDVREKLRPEPVEEIDPIADLEETYIRNVNEYEDEYEPIINETHDEFGEYYEPDYDEVIRQENTRRLMGANRTPEPEIAEPKQEVIKSKPARNNIKIELNNVEVVLKKGDEIIFNHDGETYSSQVYAINGDDISVRYRRKDIVIKPEDVKKVY